MECQSWWYELISFSDDVILDYLFQGKICRCFIFYGSFYKSLAPLEVYEPATSCVETQLWNV